MKAHLVEKQDTFITNVRNNLANHSNRFKGPKQLIVFQKGRYPTLNQA